MRKRFILSGILLLFVVLGAAFLVIQRGDSDSFSETKFSQSDEQENLTEIQFETVYVLVSKFKSYTQSISFEDIKNYPLIALSTEKESISQIISNEVETLDTLDELYAALISSEENKFAIIPVDKIDIRFKIIKVDDNDIFLKDNDLSDYQLRFISKQKVNLEEEDFIPEGYKYIEQSQVMTNFIKDDWTRFFTAGEIITARGVDIMWLQRSDNNLLFLFDRVKEDIQEADLAISMLEHSYQGNPVPCPRCTSFVGDESLLKQIKDIGIDVLSLAGNHIGDGGVGAEIRTEELMKSLEFEYFGAGENIAKASEPAVVEVKGVKYAFLGADDVATFYWAGSESRGANRYSYTNTNGEKVIDKEKIKKDIKAAKTKADYVVFYMSWGIEYVNYPEEYEVEMAHEMIDAGADLILSSHAHWVKNMEIYKGKLIMYSLGNFIFDQTHTEPSSEAVYLNLHFLDSELKNIEIVPTLMCGYHFGAKNLAYDFLNGKITYSDIDKKDPAKECIWLQPRPLGEEHPKYKVILDRLFQHTNI